MPPNTLMAVRLRRWGNVLRVPSACRVRVSSSTQMPCSDSCDSSLRSTEAAFGAILIVTAMRPSDCTPYSSSPNGNEHKYPLSTHCKLDARRFESLTAPLMHMHSSASIGRSRAHRPELGTNTPPEWCQSPYHREGFTSLPRSARCRPTGQYLISSAQTWNPAQQVHSRARWKCSASSVWSMTCLRLPSPSKRGANTSYQAASNC